MRIEFHPAEGGDDAHAFAGELAGAVAKHFGAAPVEQGRVHVVECP